GDPSQGKSLLTLDLASRLTTGRELPNGYQPSQLSPVVFVNSEDGVRDTVLPRLQAAGADLRRVHLFRGRPCEADLLRLPPFPDDWDLLGEVVVETGARLVVIDPLMAFLSVGYCSLNDQLVRQALTPLADVADQTRAAILLVRHLNKGGQGQKAI